MYHGVADYTPGGDDVRRGAVGRIAAAGDAPDHHSPQWEGFYVSALGGAMYVFHRVGANYVWLRGRCPTDSVLLIRLKDGEYSVRLEPIDADTKRKLPRAIRSR